MGKKTLVAIIFVCSLLICCGVSRTPVEEKPRDPISNVIYSFGEEKLYWVGTDQLGEYVFNSKEEIDQRFGGIDWVKKEEFRIKNNRFYLVCGTWGSGIIRFFYLVFRYDSDSDNWRLDKVSKPIIDTYFFKIKIIEPQEDKIVFKSDSVVIGEYVP